MSDTGAAIASRVDRLLARHGVYRPLDLLVELRRLPEPALAEWRRDPAIVLEDRLLGDPERCADTLNEAARWARRLGLARELRVPSSADGQPLLASRRPALQQLLLTEYHRVDDSPQLDLFLDNPQTAARNRLVDALHGGDAAAAAEALEQLQAAGAGHTELTAAETLVDALDWPGDEPPAAAEGLAFIETRLQPAATELLGRRATDFLRRYWSRLADSLDPARFDPTQPRLHPSWLALQAGDWAGVVEAARAVPGCWQEPVLLARLAEAGIALGDRGLALTSLDELCWHDAATAEQWLRTCRDAAIAPLRERFWDLEPELDIALFPAWLALHLPTPEPATAPEPWEQPARQAYTTARALRDHKDDTDLRKTLHAQCPALLAHWLNG